MAQRYLFDFKNHQPTLYQEGEYLFSVDGQPKHWLDKEFGYSYETQKPSLWIDGKFVYGLNPDGTPASSNPDFYYGD